MMDMQERAALIEGLKSRGFEDGAPRVDGWSFIDRQEGLTVHFRASGQFTFRKLGTFTEQGTMSQPSDLLNLIDTKAREHVD